MKGRYFLLEQLITIELFGKQYTFKAETQVEKAKEVAEMLVKEVEKAESQQKGSPSRFNPLGIMILTAMNIAGDNIDIKENYLDFKREVFDKSSILLSKLENF